MKGGSVTNSLVYIELFGSLELIISRSEQAPESGFHPCDKSENNYCGFLGPSWCNKKVDPES